MMHWIRLLALLSLAPALPACSQPAADLPGVPATVVQVRDGDTLVVEVGGKREDVRLLGVDTPEMNYRTGEPDPYALEATLFTREQAGGTTVRLAGDPLNQDRDHYDRLLRYVYLDDGRMLNLELVRNGYGFPFLDFPLTERDRIIEAWKEALKHRRGLLSDSRLEAVPYDRAPAYEDRAVAVQGRITGGKTITSRSGERICFLNFHQDYKRYVTIVILESEFHRFGGDPGPRYRGETVTVTGRVRERKGRLQIQVLDPAQIVINR